MLRSVLLTTLVLAGCTRAPAVPAPPATTPPAAPAAAEVVPPFDPCGARPGCKVDARLDAGVSGVEVVRATLPVSEGGDCTPIEHWLVTLVGGAPRTGRLLTRTCNDGYGAAGVGEDGFSIVGGVFEHAQSGGSNWRFTRTCKVALSPLRWIAVADGSFWTVGPVNEQTELDLRSLVGHTEGALPICGASGEYTDESPLFRYAFAPIPLLEALPPEVRGPLAQLGLGDCALRIDASGAHGYLLKGEPGSPADARMSVLAVDEGTLLIEIEDDQRTGPSARWLADDHVEIWASAGGDGDDCHRGKVKAWQWAIRIADGQVFPAYGKPEPLSAEVLVLDARRARLRVSLPAHEGVSVVYSDGDDGTTQERLLSTSKLSFGDGASLSRTRSLSARAARCTWGSGVLTLAPGDDPPEGEPYLPSE